MDRSRVRISRLLAEAVEGIATRPSRSALIVVGTMLGVGSFVTVLGLTATANAQIGASFNAQSSTEVSIGFADGAPVKRFDPGADARVAAIDGVQAVGVHQELGLEASALPRRLASGVTPPPVRVTAVSHGFFDVAGPRLVAGRLFDPFLEQQPVVLLGERAARALGITTLTGEPAVYLDDQPFTVVGLIRSGRVSAMASGVMIPLAYARASLRDETPEAMTVVTRVGAGETTAEQAPLAIAPYDVRSIVARYPPRATALREAVSDQLRLLFIALAAVCMVIGSIGIINVNLMAVIERTSEIGLRRSLGATRLHVVGQLLVESSVLGVLGGMVGGLVGEVAVVIVSVVQDWTPTLDARTLLAAPAVGTLVGIVGGAYPAARAARIEPVEAFRRA
ncbi:ABC transporter permease [Nocardioides ginsengisoli]|uniref:ABC transporter permease n=1 Tax=Nocardioides ginsengisoli TaxID=363868 RepID=A0ABW3W6E0_9ACTN